MSAEIDRLDIAIEAQAAGAKSEIEKLYQQLDKISGALNRSASGYRSTAKEIGRVTAAVQAMSRIRMPDFSRTVTQLQALSKISLANLTGKKIDIDIGITGAAGANSLKSAIEQVLSSGSVDTSKLSKRILEEFDITGKRASTKIRGMVRDLANELAKGFDGENAHMTPAADALLDSLANEIKRNGSVITSNLSAEISGHGRDLDQMRERYRELLQFLEAHPIKITTDDVSSDYYENIRSSGMLRYIRNDGTNTADSIAVELKDAFGDIFTQDFGTGIEGILDTIMEKVSQAREAIRRDPIINLSDQEQQMASSSIWENLFSMTSKIHEAIKSSVADAQKAMDGKILLDVEVDQEKILRDIKAAINRASSATYDPVKVTLKADNSSVKNAVQQSISGMDAGTVPQLAESYERIVKALQNMSTVAANSKGVEKIFNTLRRFATMDMSKFDTSAFASVADTIERISKFPDAAGSVNRLINALVRLSNAGAAMQTAAAGLPVLANGVQNAMAAIAASPDPSESVNRTFSALTKLATAGDRVSASASGLPAITAAVQNFFNAMANAPAIASGTTSVLSSLAAIATSGSGVRKAGQMVATGFDSMNKSAGQSTSAFQKLIAAAKALLSALSRLGSAAGSALAGVAKASAGLISHMTGIGNSSRHIDRAANSFGNLLRKITPFIGAYKLFQWTKESVNLASSLTEVQNVVDHAFGSEGAKRVDEFADKSIEKYGMAALTAKQISSRFQSMGVSMGVTADQVKNATSEISGSIGKNATDYTKASEGMEDMSLNLTRLTADLASFYDKDVSQVAEAMNSVYTGTTRPLRAYGLDLTQATLKEWALKNGMDADIASMTQAEKALLRYKYVLANTTMIHGDAERTADTWANTMRRVKQNLQALGATMGGIIVNAFTPLLRWMNNAIKNINAFVESVGNALGKIFGWTIKTTPAGLADDSYGEMADGINDVADGAGNAAGNLQDATDAAKEFQRTILGFDEINKLNEVTDKTGNGTGNGGSPNGGGASGLGGSAIAGTADVVSAGKPLIEYYKSSIKDLEGLGDYISKTLTDAMGRINWNTVYRKASGFGTGLAQFLNGLIKPELFAALGTTVGGAINTALHALDSFGTTFKWGNFGTSLATGINSFFKTWDADLQAKNFATFVNGISDAMYAALTTFRASEIATKISNCVKDALAGVAWENKVFPAADMFGTKLAQFLNGLIKPSTFWQVGTTTANVLNTVLHAIDTVGKKFNFRTFGLFIAAGINAYMNTFDFELVARSFNRWASGVIEALRTAIDNIHWRTIGSRIGNFLRNIKWEEHFWGVASLLGDAINAVIDLAKSIIDPSGLGTPLTDALDTIKQSCENFKTSVDWDKLAESVKKLVDALAPAGEGFAKGLADAFAVLAGIGGVTLNLIGIAFEKIANAINSLPEGAVEKFGHGLGVAAAAFVTFKMASGAADIISKVAGALTGAATAAEAAGTGTTVAAGGVGALIGKVALALSPLIKTSGAITGFAIGSEMAKVKIDDETEAIRENEEMMERLGDQYPISVEGLGRMQEALGLTKSSLDWSKISYDDLRTAVSNLYKEGEISLDMYDQLTGALTTMMSGGVTPVKDAYRELGSEIDSLSGEKAPELNRALTDQLAKGMQTTGSDADSAKGKISKMQEGVWGFAGGMLAKTILMAVLGTTFGGFGTKADEASGKVSDMGKDIDATIKTLTGSAKEGGKGFSDGLITPIKDSRPLLQQTVKSMGDSDMIGTLKTSLDERSPSHKAEDIGTNFTQGLINGVSGKTSELISGLKSMAGDMLSAFTDIAGDFYSAGQSWIDNLNSGIASVDITSIDTSSIVSYGMDQEMYNAGFSAMNSFSSGMSDGLQLPRISASWDRYTYGDGGWFDIPNFSISWYANGGFPNLGELFIANEKGPEMLGKMGNRNVVANNAQITEGIRQAVVDGMMEVAMATSVSNDETPYVINMRVVTDDDETLARRVERGRMRREARYATASFA